MTSTSIRPSAGLLADPSVSGTAISVETLRGPVQLSGFVDSAAQAIRAVDIARRVEGANEVINKMTLNAR